MTNREDIKVGVRLRWTAGHHPGSVSTVVGLKEQSVQFQNKGKSDPFLVTYDQVITQTVPVRKYDTSRRNSKVVVTKPAKPPSAEQVSLRNFDLAIPGTALKEALELLRNSRARLKHKEDQVRAELAQIMSDRVVLDRSIEQIVRGIPKTVGEELMKAAVLEDSHTT